jgi:hypothetical protein
LTTHVVANGDQPGGSSVGIRPAGVEQSFRILKCAVPAARGQPDRRI